MANVRAWGRKTKSAVVEGERQCTVVDSQSPRGWRMPSSGKSVNFSIRSRMQVRVTLTVEIVARRFFAPTLLSSGTSSTLAEHLYPPPFRILRCLGSKMGKTRRTVADGWEFHLRNRSGMGWKYSKRRFLQADSRVTPLTTADKACGDIASWSWGKTENWSVSPSAR